MVGSASAGSVSVENNHLRDIGVSTVAAAAMPGQTIGIGILRAEAATVAGNTLRKVGQAAQGKELIAGIAALSVQRPRIGGNEVTEVGPLENFGGTVFGITIRAPYAQAEVHHNRVERDAQFNDVRSNTEWYALNIDEPRPDNGGVSRLARHTAVRVDDRRMLVLLGERAFVHAVHPAIGVDPATGAAVGSPGASASVLGNVLIARGRTPAVEIAASGDVVFNDNRCELRANFSTTAVLLSSPVAVISANRVRGAEDSIRVPDQRAVVTAIGNITTRPISAPLRPEMLPLNLIA
jgi:hypothetical protein